MLWADTRPGFDPYGWLVWGHQTLAGALNTNAAPSWKPLPFLFTVPYALFGHYELWLWMITCVAVSLGGAIAAGRITYRVTVWPVAEPDRARRYAGIAAGMFAGLALLGIRDWWHYMLSSQSDTMIVALCLGAIDCHLSERPALGIRARRPGRARAPRGVAVPGDLLDLGVASDPVDAVADRRSGSR